MAYAQSDVLINRLKAHLEHVKDILGGKTLQTFNEGEKYIALCDEVHLMLALIEGLKEK